MNKINNHQVFIKKGDLKSEFHLNKFQKLTGFNVTEDTASSIYIVDDVSTLQFHYLLRM